jgi:adenosylcobinamide-GDP ribazoletransferase
MPKLPHGLIVALQFLTRLPTPRLAGAWSLAGAAVYVPLVGLLLGVLLQLAVWLGSELGPWIGGLAGLIVWVWATGGIHLDGLGDVADALASAHKAPQRFLEVLADPHVGSFAVIAIALQIATKLVLLAALSGGAGLAALVLVPAWARWGALVWSCWLPPIKDGLGRAFAGGAGGLAIALWGCALLAASAWLAPLLSSALLVVALGSWFFARRLGGVNGDCLGAGIEVSESLLTLVLLLEAHFKAT